MCDSYDYKIGNFECGFYGEKEPLSSDAVLDDVRPLLKFVDWILESKIHLCDKRCLMKDIDTEFGNVKSNYCKRESCPDLVLKLLADNVRAHFI